MDEIERKQIEYLNKYKSVLSLEGEAIRNRMIEITKSAQKEFQDLLTIVKIHDVPLGDCEQFKSKKDIALSFWRRILSITGGLKPVSPRDYIIIPSKIKVISKTLEECQTKQELGLEDSHRLVDCYRSSFEICVAIISPSFKLVIAKKQSDHIKWAYLKSKILAMDKSFESLFTSMDNDLRNNLAHEGYYIKEDKLYTKKKDGTFGEYELEYIFDRILEILCLVCVLYWALSEEHTKLQIAIYEKQPVNKIKEALKAALKTF